MKKRKRLFGILLAVVMTVAMMTGCSAGKGGTSGSGVKVGFLAPTLQTEFMIGIDEKLHEECDNRGWDYVSASFDNDSAAAVSAIENMVTGNCNYIVAMVSDTSCDDALKAAQEKGVKIIECGVETAVHDLVLITDQYSIGTQIGDMAAAVESVEAVKAAGKDNENFGVFACDGTNQALKGINDGTCMRGTMYFEPVGSVMAEYIQQMVDGKTVDEAVETPIHAVTKANIADYYKADK